MIHHIITRFPLNQILTTTCRVVELNCRVIGTPQTRHVHTHTNTPTGHRVCVIGAGPSGMNLVGIFKKLRGQGSPVSVTCYEKQRTPGGLWNFTWRTGTDEFGEPVHGSLYQDLFSNGPKECLELPEYTFVDHFGRNIPSFVPREVMLDYLHGYWRSLGVEKADIKTAHCVRDVRYNENTKNFTVRVTDLISKTDEIKNFDYVVVATGHFSTPDTPTFAGMDTFRGRILHAHEFRNAREFSRQDIIVVGSSYSAEDIALQCYKFGSDSIAISHRRDSMKYKWPKGIREKPIITWMDKKTVHFKDGSFQQADVIILCTGYKHYFPFMQKEIRLESENVTFPPNLYQSLQWYATEPGQIHADGRVFYMAMQSQCYTLPMFNLQSHWVAHVIKGLITTPNPEFCSRDILAWVEANKEIINSYREIDAQTAYVKRLANDVGYPYDVDASKIYYQWEWDKLKDILTYRDRSYTSRYTGHQSRVRRSPWLQSYDDTLTGFVNE